MDFTSVTNPTFANAQSTAILCGVVFTALGASPVPFMASPNDVEPWGQQIFADCIAGKHGTIAPFVVPVPTAAQLSAYASAKQSTVAAGGISVNVAASGAPQMVEVASDAAGCLNMSGAVQLASINPAQTFNWINANGSVVSLNATQILAMGVALGTFVQSTYTALGAVLAAIAAATITTTAQIDAFAWPPNS